jgi:hypothetical protein
MGSNDASTVPPARHPPGPASAGEPDAGRRRTLKVLAGLGVAGATGVAAWSVAKAQADIAITRLAVSPRGWPPALAGLRIAVLSDFHRSDLVSRAHVQRAVAMATAEQPDLVVLLGDYISFRERTYVEDVAESLGGLHAPLGVVAVLGNHDDERRLAPALERRGITVLPDARTLVTARGARLDLVGIRYWTRRPQAIARLLSGATGVPVLLAHDPRRLAAAAALDIPLVLSGHTHGGQVVLPGLGAVAARKFPVVSGLGRSGSSTLFVTRGIGTVYVPFRLNCPPEVAVLTLGGEVAAT